MKTITIFLFAALMGITTAFGEALNFRGVMNTQHGVRSIEMNILVKDGKITGSYSYDGSKGKLRLEGTLSKANITLDEFDNKGQKTGQFVGSIDLGESCDGPDQVNDPGCKILRNMHLAENRTSYRGNWTPAKGKGEVYFSLNQQVQVPSTIEIEAEQFKPRPSPMRILNVSYPVIKGSKWSTVNAAMKDIVMQTYTENDYASESEKESIDISYVVTHLDDSYISFELTGMSILAGTAHPNIINKAITLDVKTGKQIKLGDVDGVKIFKNHPMVKEMKREITPDMSFAFSNKGLVIYLDLPHVTQFFSRVYAELGKAK